MKKYLFIFIGGFFLISTAWAGNQPPAPPTFDLGANINLSAQAVGQVAPAVKNPFEYGVGGLKDSKSGLQLPTITQCASVSGGVQTRDFGTCVLWLLDRVLALVYTIALFWAVIKLVLTGIDYINSGGKIEAAHGNVKGAVIGIVVAVVAFSAVKGLEYTLTRGEGAFTTINSGPTTGGQSGTGQSGGELGGQVVQQAGFPISFSVVGGVVTGLSENEEEECAGRYGITYRSDTSGGSATFSSWAGLEDYLYGTQRDVESGTGSASCYVTIAGGSTLQPGSGQAGSRPITGRAIKPRIMIEDDTIAVRNNQVQLVAYTDRMLSNGDGCDLAAKVQNLTNGNDAGLIQATVSTQASQLRYNVPTDTTAGHRLRLYLTSRQCVVSSPITYTVPTVKAPVATAPPTRPAVFLDVQPRILGQQRLLVSLPQSLEDAFVQALDIFLRQSNLYDGPFYLQLGYTILADGEGSAPKKSGACNLTINLSGARVTGTIFSPVPATNIRFFNTVTSLYLPIEPGRKAYTKSFPISLGSKVVQSVRLTGVDLRSCDYGIQGLEVTNWRVRVPISAR